MLGSIGRTLLLFVAALASSAALAQPQGHPFLVDASVRQADGKVLLAGNRYTTLYLQRVNPDGGTDYTFGSGGGGWEHTPPSGGQYRVSAVNILADGRIHIVGSMNGVPALTRLMSNGELDVTFGSTAPGWVLDMIPGIKLNAAIVEPGGGILAAGSHDYQAALVRYTAGGQRDATYGTDGILTSTSGEWRVLLPMAGGGYTALGESGFFLLQGRFLATGQPDMAFGYGGWRDSSHAYNGDRVRAAIPDSGGGLLAVGSNHYSDDNPSKFAFYRIAANGQVTEYVERPILPGQYDRAHANSVALLADGDVLIAGSAYDADTGYTHFALTTLAGGQVLVGTGTPPTQYTSDRLQSAHVFGEQILAVGTSSFFTGAVARIARYFSGPLVFDRADYNPYDTQPNSFAIVPVPNAVPGEVRTSAPFRITGIGDTVSIRIENGVYSIGCVEPYTSDPGLVSNGQQVCVRVTSSSSPGGSVTATVVVAETHGFPTQADFVVTSLGPPDTMWGPSQFGGPSVPANNSGTGFVLFYFSGTTDSGPVTGHECSLDGAPFYSCDSGGFPYPHTHFNVGYGLHTFRVRAVNSYGPDPTPAEYTWTAVGESDVYFTQWPSPYSSQTTATFSFAAPYTTQFECRLDQAPFASCSPPVTLTDLADGEHVFQVRGAGTEGMGTPPTSTFTVDTVPPNAVIASGPPAMTDMGTAYFQLTSDIPDGYGVFECRLDAGDWSGCEPTAAFPVGVGPHTLDVRVTDPAGNVDATPASWSWTYEPTPPDTSIASGPSGTVTTRTVTFTYSATIASSTFQCSLQGPGQGGAFASCTAAGVTYNVLADGAYSFQVRASSPAGNTDPTPASQAFSVDGPTPDTTLVSGPYPITWETSATFVLASDQSGATFECSLDGSPFGTCPPQWQGYTGLTEGTHTFSGRAVVAGESDPTPVLFTWVIDHTDPQTTITSQPSNSSASSSATFEFAANEAPVQFMCKLDAQQFYESCTSPQAYTGLASGSHTFSVYAFDMAPNSDETPATVTWTVDLALLDTTIDSGPSGTVAVSTATFTFSSPISGVTFECSLDAAAFAACANPSGYSGLADGSHTFQVRARNAGGDVDATPASRTWTVDTTAPDTSIASGPSGTTAQNSAAFTFTATDGMATFQCSLDGADWGVCTSGVSYIALADGMHMFEVRAVDAPGNTDQTPASRTWAIDTANPNTTITSGPSAVTSETGATLAFTATESASFQCKLDAAAYGTCTSPVNLAGLAAGSHTFSVYSVDAAGNADASPATWSWVIDTSAPDTTITSSPSGTVMSSSASIAFSSPESGMTFECSLDGAAFAACTSPANLSGLPDGAHSFQVRAKDAAGNIDPSPATASWSVDSTAPDTNITVTPPPASNSSSASFSFTATEGATFECKLGAGAYAACASPKAYSGLADGSYTFSVRARDAAGNQDASPATFTWTVDTAAPNTTIASGPSGGNNTNPVTFTFTSTEGGTFDCKMDTGAFEPCTSPKVYSGLAKGQHSFEVRARDAAGNLDASPATRNFSIK